MEPELRQAADRHEFCNWYQLIVNLKTAQVRELEALVRWRHPSSRLIEPGEFISIAEETGIIIPLGRQVLKQACHQLYAWQQLYASETPLMVSVNVSGKQLLQTDLISDIREDLDDVGIDPSCLKLEITESMVMLNPERAKTTFRHPDLTGLFRGVDEIRMSQKMVAAVAGGWLEEA